MIVLNGTGVFGGIAFGRLSFFQRNECKIRRRHVEDINRELSRFEKAKHTAVAQLQTLYEMALQEMGENHAMIFRIHQMMLEDPDFCKTVESIIKTRQVNAEFAVSETENHFRRMFSAMEDSYMRERAADVKDVSDRVLGILADSTGTARRYDEPVIVAADDLAPSETVQLDKSKVLAFVTRLGSQTSHTAILSRTRNIPAVIGLGDALKEEYNGRPAVVDGFSGRIYIEPDESTTAAMEQKKRKEEEKRSLLEQLKGLDNVTRDGRRILVCANISSESDVEAALQNDAQGVGLFRSEFLYLDREDYPSEEEQFRVYRSVAEKMAGKRVVIRTLDIGADKRSGYFGLPSEENPAMGYRAIRICLTRPDLFKTQLRAVYRASAFGNVAVLFPMVISVQEVRRAKTLAAQVRQELRKEGVPFSKKVELGVMIETPAAAVICDLLAREVDFFSIGTNDLIQYTLALDRQNRRLDPFYDPHHPAVLRLIRYVVERARQAGIWVSVCGELGADLSLTEAFLRMRLDELSVSPPCILALRKKIRETDLSKG